MGSLSKSKFGNIHKIECSAGLCGDQYHVKRTNYVANISFKSFDVPPVPLVFWYKSYENIIPGANPNVSNSMEIPLEVDSFKVTFNLECDETQFGQGWRTYKLFMKLDAPAGETHDPNYVEVMVLTECPCLLPDSMCCNGHEKTLYEMSNSSVEIFTHKHDCSIQQIPGIITIKLTVIDISEATLVPLEILKLMAKRHCLQILEPFRNEWESKSHDIAIICKDGFELGAHKNILKARSIVFCSLIEAIHGVTKLEDRVTNSFAMKVILHFIYTGTLQEDWMKDTRGVIVTAKEYKLEELLKFFEHLLVEACTLQNASAVLQLAKENGLEHARKAIQKKYLFCDGWYGMDPGVGYLYQDSKFEICCDRKSSFESINRK